MCGLGPDLVGIHSIRLAARYRGAACSTTLNQGCEKIQGARGHNSAPIFALSPDLEKEFLAPSMACSTADAFNIVCRLDHDSKLDEAPQNKKQMGLQSSGTDQSLSSCGHLAPHETCIACFSSWAHCWRSSHPLQRAMRGSKISH